MSPSEPFGYFREIVYFSLVHKQVKSTNGPRISTKHDSRVTETGSGTVPHK